MWRDTLVARLRHAVAMTEDTMESVAEVASDEKTAPRKGRKCATLER